MTHQATLKIYKASAGSGKTFRLAVEYLKLVIENPASYIHILAVTFTNKATAEMKSRILTELFGIAKGLDESKIYLETILAELTEKDPDWNVHKIRKQAQESLNLLLHDYSRFHIETIDRFFQSILRNLAKELGLGAYMNIELNANSVLSEAIRIIFGKIKEDSDLLQWISDYIDEKVSEGNNWKLNKELESFGENIFREDFKNKEKELKFVLQDKKFLKNFRKRLSGLKEEKTGEVVRVALAFRTETEKYSIKTEDFAYGAKGAGAYFDRIIDQKEIQKGPNSYVEKCFESPENWATKKSPRKDEITSLAESALMPILHETEEIRRKNVQEVNTCNLILRHINNIGLLYDIADTVRELNSENNRFMLADTPNLLQELIDGNDAPFVYEKIGASLQHIMIDEFQDTSRIQWENFKPLLFEGLAQNADSLIVGDQKQSIYRWRNGDWRILGKLKNELSNINTEEISLDTNWRSEYEIVNFNNHIFKAAVPLFQPDREKGNSDMQQAYADVAQKCSKKQREGYVKADFLYEPDSEAYNTATLEKLIENIEELQEKGVAAEEITILIRKNKTIPMIAEYLANYQKEHPEKPYNYDVISDQAYQLQASLCIHILIEALRYISEPANPVYKTQLLLSYQTEIMCKNIDDLVTDIHLTRSGEIKSLEEKLQHASLLPLYELIEELYQLLELHKLKDQESYLYSFLDGVTDFLTQKSADLNAFLNYWDETLKNKTIPFSSEIEGMRIMSIHKSKGLEFHTVIIPFCDWTLTHEAGLNPLLWCNSETKPFHELPLFPVKYGKEMQNSIFNEEFADETAQLWVDNLNLLYVALTRAEKNLILIGKDKNPEGQEKKNGKNDSPVPANISELLINIFESPQNEELYKHWNAGTRQYSSGSLCSQKEKKRTSSNRLNQKPAVLSFPYFSHTQKAAFKQSNRSKDFIGEKEHPESSDTNPYINRGKLLHYLFSNIHTTEDIPEAVDRLFFEGLIHSDAEKEGLITYLTDAIQLPEVAEWFRPGVKLFNECTVIYRDETGSLQNKRPDRVIQDNDKMTVVDFKFGKERKLHTLQVKEYVSLLREMGYSNVDGYLWYVEAGRIDPVR
ncbi:MAG: UvrD-helicase domain-containing protein [Prevotellaceae bacterium]|nr:UvrD-helicase domain-containing protein [Prevotellaceae bacterium]